MKLKNPFKKSSKPCRKKLEKINNLPVIEKQKVQEKRNKERAKRQFEIVEKKIEMILGGPIRDPITGRIKIENKSYLVKDSLYYSTLLETYREHYKKHKTNKFKTTDPRYESFKFSVADAEDIKKMLLENIKKKQLIEKNKKLKTKWKSQHLYLDLFLYPQKSLQDLLK